MKKKSKKVYSIGLAPNNGPFVGATAEKRIKNYAVGLQTEKDADAYSFLNLLRFIESDTSEEAKNKFWDMDTSVRDTFYNVYTNNDKDKNARSKLLKICEIQRTKL